MVYDDEFIEGIFAPFFNKLVQSMLYIDNLIAWLWVQLAWPFWA
jgi:hypothetical protein